jgi:outer membrane receptor protein involved in Fe transport
MQNLKGSTSWLALFLASDLMLLAVPTPASAQAAAADRPAVPQAAETQEIVVTAQGRVQRLQDVPISVSVVSGAKLEAGNIRNLEDLGDRLPAVKLTPGPATDLLNIRGVGSGLNAGFEQSVGTFVDDVYRGRSRSSRAALFDIDRVEVLKGPQTTFFGNNAIAGALNITTRRAEPGESLHYNATALYAPTDGEFNLEAGISAPITDNLGVRVAAKYFGMNGYVHNSYLDEDGPHQRDFVGRVAFAWKPVSGLRSDLRIDYGRFRDQSSFPNEALNCPAPSPPYPAAAGLCARYLTSFGPTATNANPVEKNASADSRFTLNYVEAALTNELDVGRDTLTTTTSYYHHSVYNLTQPAPLPLTGIGGNESPFPTFTPESYHSFSQEVRLRSPSHQVIEYMVGAYYSKDYLSTSIVSGYYFAPFGANAPGYTTAATPIAVSLYQREHDQTASAFGSVTGHLTSRLRLNASLRYSIVKKDAFRDAEVGVGGSVPGIGFVPLPQAAQDILRKSLGGKGGNFVDPDRTDRKLMPSASLQYDLTAAMMTYASYTKGFKAGGFALSPNGDTFNPETVDAYEVGLKGSLFDRHVQFSIAGFYSRYDNLQESTNVVLPSGAIQTVVGNVAKAKSEGVDFSLTVRATSHLTFNADVGYLNARYINYPGAPCTILQTLSAAVCSQNLSGSVRAYAPKFSGNVGASLVYPVGRLELHVDPNVYFSTKYYQQSSIDPLTLQRRYAKIDLRVGVGPSDHRWEFAIIGKNLTDEITGSFRNNIPTSPGTVYTLPDRPRSVALQFSIKG